MDSGDKKFYSALILGVVICFSVLGIVMIQYSHVWSETGKVSWVGAKTYNDGMGKFVVLFAVTVPIHGTFNFTFTGYGTFCGNASQYLMGTVSSTPTKGDVVALINIRCGGYDLVVDP